jgi:hypothetical protein
MGIEYGVPVNLNNNVNVEVFDMNLVEVAR